MTTTAIRTRFNNHKSSVRSNKNFKISKHFNLPLHTVNDMQIGILEQCNQVDLQTMRIKEAIWIHEFQSVSLGLNSKEEEKTTLSPHIPNIIKHFRHSYDCTPYITAHRGNQAGSIMKRRTDRRQPALADLKRLYRYRFPDKL